MDFTLNDVDCVGEELGRTTYASIKNKLDLVNSIRFPADKDVSKSFIRGFNECRNENFDFIFFCDNEEKEKQIREDQKFLNDCIGIKNWEKFNIKTKKKS